MTTLDDQPGRDEWNVPSNQPPGHLGLPGLLQYPDDAAHFWVVVQGFGAFETVDGGTTWEPRNRGLRAAWPAPEDAVVGFCVHKLVLAADHERLYQQNHCGMYRSDDRGRSWTEITEGLPTRLRLRRRPLTRTTATRSTSCRSTPGTTAACRRAARRSGGRRTAARAGGAWTTGCRSATRFLGVLREGMAIDDLDVPGLYFGTSTGQVFASADEGESWREIASYLPGDRVGRGRGGGVAMADVHLPSTLPPLFDGLPRRLDVDAATVGDVIARLDERWPGMRDRLCEPGPALRRHINVYVDRERAGLDTALGAASRVDVIAAISGG